MRNPLLIFALRKSTKFSFSALAAASKTLLRAKRAHEKRLKRFSHGGWRRTFAVSFPEQPGGLETILRRRTKSSFKKGTENQRMGNPWFLTLWEPVFLPHPGYCVPPIGWESTNFAQRERAVRRSLLCWDCVANAKFMGQLRTKYRFCIAQALRAAVRPAFAVLICAPGLGFSGFRVCLLL